MNEFFPPDFAEQMGKTFNQLRGVIDDSLAERFEYVLVPWDKVNDLARQGWLLQPIVHYSSPSFVMSRKLGAADAAAEILRSSGGS